MEQRRGNEGAALHYTRRSHASFASGSRALGGSAGVGGGWSDDRGGREGHPPPGGTKRDRGEGEKLRSKWLEGYGWINTITGVARSRHSQPDSWRNTRAERNGRDITTPLLVIEIIRCLDTRPRLRLPSFSSSFFFSLSLDPSSVHDGVYTFCHDRQDSRRTSLKIRGRGIGA